MDQFLIQSLKGHPDEGRILRGLLGMLVRKRSSNQADMLEVSRSWVDGFLAKHDVGVTVDGVAGVYVITVTEKPDGQILGLRETGSERARPDGGGTGGEDSKVRADPVPRR